MVDVKGVLSPTLLPLWLNVFLALSQAKKRETRSQLAENVGSANSVYLKGA